jgi:hypothetical protein
MLIGDFRKILLSATIEGENAWYIAKLQVARLQ